MDALPPGNICDSHQAFDEEPAAVGGFQGIDIDPLDPVVRIGGRQGLEKAVLLRQVDPAGELHRYGVVGEIALGDRHRRVGKLLLDHLFDGTVVDIAGKAVL